MKRLHILYAFIVLHHYYLAGSQTAVVAAPIVHASMKTYGKFIPVKYILVGIVAYIAYQESVRIYRVYQENCELTQTLQRLIQTMQEIERWSLKPEGYDREAYQQTTLDFLQQALLRMKTVNHLPESPEYRKLMLQLRNLIGEYDSLKPAIIKMIKDGNIIEQEKKNLHAVYEEVFQAHKKFFEDYDIRACSEEEEASVSPLIQNLTGQSLCILSALAKEMFKVMQGVKNWIDNATDYSWVHLQQDYEAMKMGPILLRNIVRIIIIIDNQAKQKLQDASTKSLLFSEIIEEAMPQLEQENLWKFVSKAVRIE